MNGGVNMKLNIPKDAVIPAFKDGALVRAVSARALKKYNPSVFTGKNTRDGYDFVSIGLRQFAQDGKKVAALLLLDDVVRVFDGLPDDFVMPTNVRHVANRPQSEGGDELKNIAYTLYQVKLILKELVSYWRPAEKGSVDLSQVNPHSVEAGELYNEYKGLRSYLDADSVIYRLFKSKGVDIVEADFALPVAHCPFCDAKGHTLHINDKKNYWHCFACGESGDEVSFVQKMEKCSFIDAISKVTEFIKQNYQKEQEQ